MSAKKPLAKPPKWVRQRQRADGSWRVWWEPSPEARAAGFQAVELKAENPTWSIREAKRLHKEVTSKSDSTGRKTSGGRTIDSLIANYLQSRRFKTRLAPKTQQFYRDCFKVISKKWGGQSVSGFTKPVMFTWHQTLADQHGDTYAVNMIRAFSVVFSYAENIGWRPENSNPCYRLNMRTANKRKRSASWEEFDALIAAAERLEFRAMACAISLATFQAQRQKDVIEARCDAFHKIRIDDKDVWVWELVRSKRGNLGAIPLHEECQVRVAQLLADAVADQERLLIDEATSAAYSGDLFRKRWAAIRTQASQSIPSVLTLQFRDLRRTFGVWARAGGGVRDDIGDVLGNSAATDPQLGEIYTPASIETAARAIAAIKRPEAKRKTG